MSAQNGSLLVPMSDDEFRERVSEASRISLPVFKIATAILLSIALLCFTARITLRIRSRHSLYLDDYLLIFSVIMLCPATGILYTNMFHIFLLNSVGQTPELLLTTAFLPCVNAIQENHTTQAFAVLAWAAIYGVKSTFFAFFKPLIVFRRKLKIYFWTCVGFTIIVFALSTSAVFVLGMFERRAFETGMRVERQTFVFTVFVGLGDVGSDVMIVSIPILLLRNSTIPRSTKLAIGSFLSLSLFMMTCMMIRASGYSPGQSRSTEVVWRAFWQLTEACVAVIMASFTVFRKWLTPRIGSSHRDAMPTPSFVRKEVQPAGAGEDRDSVSTMEKAVPVVDGPDLLFLSSRD